MNEEKKKEEHKMLAAKKLEHIKTKNAHKEAVKKAAAEVFKQYDETFKKLSKN